MTRLLVSLLVLFSIGNAFITDYFSFQNHLSFSLPDKVDGTFNECYKMDKIAIRCAAYHLFFKKINTRDFNGYAANIGQPLQAAISRWVASFKRDNMSYGV